MPLGGGKAVIIGNLHTDKNEILFSMLGRYIESLNGRYITGEDVGTTVYDMDILHKETKYVTDMSTSYHGTGINLRE